ncbi:hypothetical protein [Streptomyces chartreusis]|uniref:hypothetical protein n=1 Tax=Streptomyces chartreusis TaxID=1969 RepID=UPI00362FFE4D
MAEDQQSDTEPRSFLTCATEVARLLGVEDVAVEANDRHARLLAHAVRKAVYAFGRRRVTAALVDYLRTGTDAERAGAVRAWYCAHVPLHADRSPAYGSAGVRDPALDEVQDIKDAWLEASMRVFAEATDPRMRDRVLLGLPTSRAAYPPRLHDLLESTLASAQAIPTSTSVVGPPPWTTKQPEPVSPRGQL